jgi:hypothetical protein
MRNETGTIPFRRHAARLAAAVLALLLGTTLSIAGNFPSGQGDGFNERDEVTGYLCVTPGCDVLRPPGISCICTKDNPWENRLSRLKLTCRKKEQGQWIACPVRPKYAQ